MTDSKKLSFSTLTQAEKFPPKFHGLVLGLVELNDLEGIDVAQPIWLSDICSKTGKFFFCLIPTKISHKLGVRMDGTQFLLL